MSTFERFMLRLMAALVEIHLYPGAPGPRNRAARTVEDLRDELLADAPGLDSGLGDEDDADGELGGPP